MKEHQKAVVRGEMTKGEGWSYMEGKGRSSALMKWSQNNRLGTILQNKET